MACYLLLVALSFTGAMAQARLGTARHSSHTFYMEQLGTVISWGYNNSGQLGTGNFRHLNQPEHVVRGAYKGEQFLGDNPSNPVVDIAALYRHSLAVTADGKVYGWGANNYGELGITPLGNQTAPMAVSKGEYMGAEHLGDNPLNRIVKVSGGINMSLVLAADGTAFSFGLNDGGQLGVGDTLGRFAPAHVRRGEYPGAGYLGDNPANPIVAIVGGGYHALALTKDGSLYAWGKNNAGQLGTGDMAARPAPARVMAGAYTGSPYLGGNPANRIVAIGAGYEHSVVLLEDGTVMMWGNNAEGNLGDGTTGNRPTPVRVLKGDYAGNAFLGDKPKNKVVMIAAGSFYTAALLRDGSVYTWGKNARGQLGNGTTTGSATPVRVIKGEYEGIAWIGDNPIGPVTAIVAGEEHVVAIADDNEAYSWGANWRMQLGNGTEDRTWPVLVNGFTASPRPLTTLTSFTGAATDANVQLRWTTGREIENQAFIVERRFENRDWDSVGFKQGAGTVYTPTAYDLRDVVPQRAGRDTLVYYRLKQVTVNGGERYFDSIGVAINQVEPGPSATAVEYFQGDTINSGVRLRWATKPEVRSQSFVIERRYQGRSWEVAGTTPGAGTTLGTTAYELFDDLRGRMRADNQADYRLRQISIGEGGLEIILDSITVHPLPAMPSTVLASFDAALSTPSRANIAWRTSAEYQASRFILERRFGVESWAPLATVSANGSMPTDYSYNDTLVGQKPSDTEVAYRLTLVSVANEQTLLDSATLQLSTSSTPVTDMTAALRLESVIPNPFSASTALSFTLPSRAAVVVELIGSDGRHIQRLLDGWFDAGVHRMVVDGSELPAGLYFVRLRMGNAAVLQPVVHIQ
jgi:alpha-tubulin suppressor-like RCC1 family protein